MVERNDRLDQWRQQSIESVRSRYSPAEALREYQRLHALYEHDALGAEKVSKARLPVVSAYMQAFAEVAGINNSQY